MAVETSMYIKYSGSSSGSSSRGDNMSRVIAVGVVLEIVGIRVVVMIV